MMGAFPGSVHYAPRFSIHERCAEMEPSATAPAIVDIVRATKPGLVVVDGFYGWEYSPPAQQVGSLEQQAREKAMTSVVGGKARRVLLTSILAGTNPLATDMVAASMMGFAPEEIPTFEWAWKAGMEPRSLDEIEIRGEQLDSVRQAFARSEILPYSELREHSKWQEFLENAS